MLVALSLMVIVLLGGTVLFMQNLRSGGLAEVDVTLNRAGRSILDELEKVIRFGEVIGLNEYTKLDCLDANTSGLSGTYLTIRNIDGLDIDYYLSDQKVASITSSMNEPYYLNSGDFAVENLQFSWFCTSGISDKIKVDMDISSTVLGTGVVISKNISREVLILNGSTN